VRATDLVKKPAGGSSSGSSGTGNPLSE